MNCAIVSKVAGVTWLASSCVNTSVTKGTVIAYVGSWGNGHDGAYDADHLHLEIGTNGLDDSNQNPIDYYPLLADCQPERGNHYYDLANHVMY